MRVDLATPATFSSQKSKSRREKLENVNFPNSLHFFYFRQTNLCYSKMKKVSWTWNWNAVVSKNSSRHMMCTGQRREGRPSQGWPGRKHQFENSCRSLAWTGGGASDIVPFWFVLCGWSDDDWRTNIESLQIRIKVLLCQRDFAGNVSIWRAIPTPPDSEGERPMNVANIGRYSQHLELIDGEKSDRFDNISWQTTMQSNDHWPEREDGIEAVVP